MHEISALSLTLAALAPRIKSLTLASAAALEVEDLGALDSITEQGLKLHGSRGLGAALAAGALAAVDFSDFDTALRFCELSKLEEPSLIARSYERVRKQRQIRAKGPDPDEAPAILHRLMLERGCHEGQLFGGNPCD